MMLASPVRAAHGKNKCDPGAGTTRSVGQTAVGMLRRQGAVGSSSLETIRLLDKQALRRSAVPVPCTLSSLESPDSDTDVLSIF